MPSDAAASRFHADRVVALRTLTETNRLEIRFGDASGKEQVVSLPLPAAADLAAFVRDVLEFMDDLNKRRPAANGH